MDFEDFRERIRGEIFDSQSLLEFYKHLKKPRDKISALIKSGKIIPIKKGLYLFSEKWRRSSLSIEVLANLIYGPSCISFEYALTQYGFLIERSQVITSLTIGNSKIFETGEGIFEYRAINAEKFKIGIEYRDLGNAGGYFIASKEKALADLVYKTPGIRTLENLKFFLFDEMRIDQSLMRTFNKDLLQEIGHIYKKKSVRLLVDL